MKIRLFCFAVLVLIAMGWLWPQKVVLSESEYDIAIALYRVCNQSSEDGLAKIEVLLAEQTAPNSNRNDSPFTPIILTAKAGQWQAAAKACRRILDDQVVGSPRTND